MAYVAVTNAQIAAGAPADQTLFQKIKDDLDFLYGMIGSLPNTLPNGSFEIDSDNDGVPDGGTKNLLPGGSMTLEEGVPLHGKRCILFTSPGGAGNGGGYWDFDYIEVGQSLALAVSWMHLSSVAGIHNIVRVLWYDKDKVYVSQTDLYNSASNPVSVTHTSASAVPPASARFAKIRLIGADNDNTTAGYAIFDGVTVGFRRVDTVTGSASTSSGAGPPDRIHIDGTLASPLGTSILNSFGAATGITGGRAVTVDYRTSGASILSLSLTLPVGLWTIQAFGASSDLPSSTLSALAIREI